MSQFGIGCPKCGNLHLNKNGLPTMAFGPQDKDCPACREHHGNIEIAREEKAMIDAMAQVD